MAVSLLGFSLGAIFANRLGQWFSLAQLAGASVLLVLPIWLALSHFSIAWVMGSFALPFVCFGAASTLAWQSISDSVDRSRLYFVEAIGAVIGLVLVGPIMLSSLPINSFSTVGFNNHLRDLAASEPIQEHRQWSSAYATTDMVRTNRHDAVYFFTDARFVTRSVAWDGESTSFKSEHVEELARLKRVALASASKEDILLLGAGAGFDIAVALQAGAQRIDAVEVNDKTIEMAMALDDWAGGVMSNERVVVHIDEARKFVSQRQAAGDKRWDQINLTLLQTSPSAGRGSSRVDGRVLTREAISTYLSLLKPGGTISIIQNSPDLADRTTSTALSVVDSASQVLRFELLEGHETNPFNHLLIVRGEPYSEVEAMALARIASDFGATRRLQFSPGKVATDDSPFLFDSVFASSVHVLAAGVAALVLLSLLVFKHRRQVTSGRLALASALIGAVGMAFQALVIYRMQAVVGNPVLALSLALSATLLGAGVGALLVQKLNMNWVAAALSAIAGCLVFVTLGKVVFAAALPLTSSEAAVVATTFVLFCSLPLGLPFLAVMQEAKLAFNNLESLVLASDGLGGVVGAAIAVIGTMLLGFDFLGVAILGLLFGFLLLR